MAIYEQDVVMFETKENGDKVIKMPISRANNIEGIGRSISTAYAVGEVVYVDNNKKVALKCTQAGTTSSSELNVSTASIGNVITDGTVKWKVCNRTSDVTSVNGKTGDVVVDTLPVGTVIAYTGVSTPEGFLACNGASVSRTTYKALFDVVGTTYGAGDGSTTFNLPNMSSNIVSDVATGNVAVVGTGKALGLTNGSTDYGMTIKYSSGAGSRLSGYTSSLNVNVGTKTSTTGDWHQDLFAAGVSTNSSNSNLVAKMTATKTTVKYCIKY